MKHAAARNLDEIGDLIKAVALDIEQGNVEDVPKNLSIILHKYGDEIIKWRREYQTIDKHPLNDFPSMLGDDAVQWRRQ